MIDMTIEQKGLRELDEKLKLLPLEIQRTIGQRALNKGARLVRDEARRRAPVGKAFYRYPYGTTARNRKRIGKKIPRILAGMQGKFSEQEKE